MLERLRSLRRLFAAGGVLALLAALILALPAHAAGPAVTIDPATRLNDNQFVTVSWSGFKPNGEVWIRECQKDTGTLDACTGVNQTLLVTGKDGIGVTVYQVHTGQVGAATCDYQHACELGVFPKVDALSGAVFADIAFSFPPDACPDPSGTTAGGSGDDTANLSLFNWSADVCQAPQSLSIKYLGSNSYDGLDNFADATSDFAASTQPLSAGNEKTARAHHRKWAYAPLSESGLVLAYNIVDQRNGQRITNLKLTPDLVAKIFTKAELGIWNVSEVTSINPGHTFPPLVGAVGRADHTPSTLLLTRYMKATAPDVYTCKPTNNYSTSECDLGITLKTTPEDAAAAVWQHSDADLTQTGYIGWMDSSTAEFYGLPAAQIQTQAHPPVYQSPTQASIDKGIADATVNSDGVTITPQFTGDPDAYPLPEMTVAVLPTTCVSDDLKTVLSSFATWAVADGQSADNLPLGYFTLSSDLVTKAHSSIAKLSTTCPASGGGGAGGGFGVGGGGGGGGIIPPPPTSPPPSPSPSPFSPSPSPTIQYTAAGARLSSPLSSAVIPLLIAVGVICILVGPAIEIPVEAACPAAPPVSQTAVRVGSDPSDLEPQVTGGRGDRHDTQPPHRSRPPLGARTITARSLIAVGLLVLLFLGYELFATTIMEARSQTKLLALFQARLARAPSIDVPPFGGPIGLLEIPRFASQVVVVQGVRSTDLQKGPGHDPGSPMPGQVGDAVLEGHRTTYGAPFRRIAELERGDSINVYTAEGRFQYTVLGVRTTTSHPTIATTTEVGYLTLITSAPSTFAPNRQVQVLAQLVTQPLTPLTETQLAVGAVRNGSGVDNLAFAPVLLWGELFLGALVLAWWLYRTWSPWATYLITTPIVVALMFLLFSSVDRLLPVTL